MYQILNVNSLVDGLSVSAEICHGRREKEDNLTRECLLRRIIHINLAFFGGDYAIMEGIMYILMISWEQKTFRIKITKINTAQNDGLNRY